MKMFQQTTCLKHTNDSKGGCEVFLFFFLQQDGTEEIDVLCPIALTITTKTLGYYV